ncbi:MAG: hypothetical protein GC136_06585 [Alphaproteobacteria bacterium]|nr:hypothetical protein [Alphaproteobacteria bacterium]
MSDIKAKVIKASYDLQQRVGTGKIDEAVIQKAEVKLQENTEDFGPIATGFLEALAVAIAQAKKGEVSKEELLKSAVEPVMNLKANAKMFGYEMVTQMANVMLNFLEKIPELDGDAVAIIDANQKTLYAIIMKKMKGDGGDYGRMLEAELRGAVQRYMSKKNL